MRNIDPDFEIFVAHFEIFVAHFEVFMPGLDFFVFLLKKLLFQVAVTVHGEECALTRFPNF